MWWRELRRIFAVFGTWRRALIYRRAVMGRRLRVVLWIVSSMLLVAASEAKAGPASAKPAAEAKTARAEAKASAAEAQAGSANAKPAAEAKSAAGAKGSAEAKASAAQVKSAAGAKPAAEAKAARADVLRWVDVAAAPRALVVPGAFAGLYQLCGQPHVGLVRVARQLAKTVATGGRPDGGARLAQRVRAAGVPHLGARAWALSGEHGADVVQQRMQAWLRGASTPAALRQCGVVRRGTGSRQVVAVVTSEALAQLRPFPLRTEAYRWQQLDAQVRLPLHAAQVILLGPGAAPHRVPASIAGGRVRARFRLDRPGRWLVQLVGDLDDGPRPLLTIESYVDASPPRHLPRLVSVGARGAGAGAGAVGAGAGAGAEGVAAEGALLSHINRLRRQAGLVPLRPHAALEQIARRHAATMRARRRVAHDLGAGTPDVRASHAGLDGDRVGENLARAGSASRVMQAWWDSPSHRQNLLDSRYRYAGLAIMCDQGPRHCYGALMLMR